MLCRSAAAISSAMSGAAGGVSLGTLVSAMKSAKSLPVVIRRILAGRVAFDAKSVRNVSRTEGEVACLKQPAAVFEDHRHLAFEDIEQLVLGPMHVPGQLEAGRYDLLDQAEVAVGQFPVRLDPGREAEKPDLADGAGGRARGSGSNHVHRGFLTGQLGASSGILAE